MSVHYPGDREREQLHSQADNVPDSGTGMITIRGVEQVMAAANNQVLIDCQELADLRRQLAKAQQAYKPAEESQQVIGMLWHKQQSRVELAEKALAEAQARIWELEIALDENRRMANSARQTQGLAEVDLTRTQAQCAAMRQVMEKWRDVRAICRTCKEHDCEEACEDVELRVNEARVATEAILATAAGKALLAEVERLREALQQRGGEG